MRFKKGDIVYYIGKDCPHFHNKKLEYIGEKRFQDKISVKCLEDVHYTHSSSYVKHTLTIGTTVHFPIEYLKPSKPRKHHFPEWL